MTASSQYRQRGLSPSPHFNLKNNSRTTKRCDLSDRMSGLLVSLGASAIQRQPALLNRITLTSLRRAGRATLAAIQLYRHGQHGGDELRPLSLVVNQVYRALPPVLKNGQASRLRESLTTTGTYPCSRQATVSKIASKNQQAFAFLRTPAWCQPMNPDWLRHPWFRTPWWQRLDVALLLMSAAWLLATLGYAWVS